MITEIEKVENLLQIGNYEIMYRINYNGYRLYIQPEPFAYYSGLTGALDKASFAGDPDKKRLKSWRESMIDSYGAKAANDYVDMTAEFGTLLHTALVTIKNAGKIDWSFEKDHALNYFIGAYKKRGIEPDTRTINKMVYEYQKHVASLLQWVYERVHEIYAIETIVKSDELKIATPVDIYCSCRQTDKGEYKKTVINIKTSARIANSHLDQVAMELLMWNDNYEAAECGAIIRTKDWTEGKTPTYDYKYTNFENALTRAELIKRRLLLCLQTSATYYPEPISKTFEGITKAGEMPNIAIKSLEEDWMTEKEIIK